MRFLRPLAVLGVLAFLIGGAVPARAETLTDLAKRLGELRKRVGLWTHLLTQDKDKDAIALYRAQTKEDFEKPGTGTIQATALVAIMKDRTKADKNVRLKAMEALKAAPESAADPELGPRINKGVTSKRAQFALKNLVGLLKEPDKKEGDRLTREYANEILGKWFAPSGSNRTAIELYQAENEATWKKAYDAWRDVLKDS